MTMTYDEISSVPALAARDMAARRPPVARDPGQGVAGHPETLEELEDYYAPENYSRLLY